MDRQSQLPLSPVLFPPHLHLNRSQHPMTQTKLRAKIQISTTSGSFVATTPTSPVQITVYRCILTTESYQVYVPSNSMHMIRVRVRGIFNYHGIQSITIIGETFFLSEYYLRGRMIRMVTSTDTSYPRRKGSDFTMDRRLISQICGPVHRHRTISGKNVVSRERCSL